MTRNIDLDIIVNHIFEKSVRRIHQTHGQMYHIDFLLEVPYDITGYIIYIHDKVIEKFSNDDVLIKQLHIKMFDGGKFAFVTIDFDKNKIENGLLIPSIITTKQCCQIS